MSSLRLLNGPCRMVSQTNALINLNRSSFMDVQTSLQMGRWTCSGGHEGASLTHRRHYGIVKQRFNTLTMIQIGKCSASQLLKCQCSVNQSWQVHQKTLREKVTYQLVIPRTSSGSLAESWVWNIYIKHNTYV